MVKMFHGKVTVTFIMATLTRVPCVVVLVIEMPLKSGPSDFVLMAVPNLDRIAFELKGEEKGLNIWPSKLRVEAVKGYNSIRKKLL
jgi:hypothetical protein